MKDAERRDLLEVLEDRYGRASTIITSQMPTKTWRDALHDPTITDAYYYVITPHKEAKLPVLGTSEPGFRHDTVYTWTVTTHGTFATMDEATGPEGYLDSYCYGRLRGPRRGPGSHTESPQRSFTTAP